MLKFPETVVRTTPHEDQDEILSTNHPVGIIPSETENSYKTRVAILRKSSPTDEKGSRQTLHLHNP
jgi:hypothetical protein